MPNTFSQNHIILGREAGIAAGLLASGVTVLRKANAIQHGLYNQAFFNLSIGFERAAKLAFIVDYVLDHPDGFPTDADLRNFGHGIAQLMNQANLISQRRRNGSEYSVIPSTNIHSGIIRALDNFARTSRYYNLDSLVQSNRGSQIDPLEEWFTYVGQPILQAHYRPRRRAVDEAHARQWENDIGNFARIFYHTETGREISSISENFMHTQLTKIIQKYGQFYTLQLIRFFAFLLADLGMQAQQQRVADIPYFADFFRVFMNPDSILKSSSTWAVV